MRKVIFCIMLILLCFSAVAEQQIISTEVKTETANDRVKVSIQGGNTIDVSCNTTQTLTQNLTTTKEVSCDGKQTCESQFSQFVSSFDLFVDAYN